LRVTAFLSFPIAGLIFVLASDFTKIFLSDKIGEGSSKYLKYLDDNKRIIEVYETGHSFEKICFITRSLPLLIKEHIKYYEKLKKEMNLNNQNK